MAKFKIIVSDSHAYELAQMLKDVTSRKYTDTTFRRSNNFCEVDEKNLSFKGPIEELIAIQQLIAESLANHTS
jgi:hypothetical protein